MYGKNSKHHWCIALGLVACWNHNEDENICCHPDDQEGWHICDHELRKIPKVWNAESTINIQQWRVWYAVNMFNIENVTIIVNFGYVTGRHNQIISFFPILIGFRYLNPYSLNIKIRTIAHGQHRVRCPFDNAKITLSDSVIGPYSVSIRFEYVISLCGYRESQKKPCCRVHYVSYQLFIRCFIE